MTICFINVSKGEWNALEMFEFYYLLNFDITKSNRLKRLHQLNVLEIYSLKVKKTNFYSNIFARYHRRFILGTTNNSSIKIDINKPIKIRRI